MNISSYAYSQYHANTYASFKRTTTRKMMKKKKKKKKMAKERSLGREVAKLDTARREVIRKKWLTGCCCGGPLEARTRRLRLRVLQLNEAYGNWN